MKLNIREEEIGQILNNAIEFQLENIVEELKERGYTDKEIEAGQDIIEGELMAEVSDRIFDMRHLGGIDRLVSYIVKNKEWMHKIERLKEEENEEIEPEEKP
jgi:hypothetical protein